PDKDQRGQQDKRESVERCADARGGSDQPEGNQPPADRAKEHRRPAGRLRDRRRAGTLECEMLGGHECDRRRAWLGLSLFGASLTVCHDVARFLEWVDWAI